MLTGALLVIPGVAGFVFRTSHAGPTCVRPLPCSYAWYPLRKRAPEKSDFCSCAGVGVKPFCSAAEMRSAPAPADIGEAIDVPGSSRSPAGAGTGRAPTPPANGFSDMFHAGHVESSEPGETMFGFRPPSSRGPRDENVHSVSSFGGSFA